MDWIQSLSNEARDVSGGKFEMPEFDAFWQRGLVRFPRGEPWLRHADFREYPEVDAVGTPSGCLEISSRTIENYGYVDCGADPKWMKKAKRSHGGPGSDTYPVWLQSCDSDQRRHSQMCDSEVYRAIYAVQGREPNWMSPQDVEARGLVEGDLVPAVNDRGQLLIGVKVSESFAPGVARISGHFVSRADV